MQTNLQYTDLFNRESLKPVSNAVLTIAVALLLSLLLLDKVPAARISYWLPFLVFAAFFRLYIFRVISSPEISGEAERHAKMLFVLAAGLVGLAWGMAVYLLNADADLSARMIVLVVLAGIAAAGAFNHSIQLSGSVAFLLMASIPVIFWLAASDYPGDRELVYMVLVYVTVLYLYVAAYHRRLLATLGLSRENTFLSSELELEVSNRKNLEQGAWIAEENYRRFVEIAPDAILVTDEQGRIILANVECQKLFGYKEDELLGATIEKLIPDRFCGHHEKLRENYIRTPHQRKLGQGMVLAARTSGGKEIPVEVSLSPMETTQGRVIYVSVRDLSLREQYRALQEEVKKRESIEQELVRSYAEHQVITNSVPDLMYKVSCDGNLIWWNATLENVTGLDEKELSGRHGTEFFVECDREKIGKAIAATLENGRSEVEAEFITRLGPRTYHFNSVTLDDENGRPVAIVGAGRDITENRRIEKERQQLQQQLLQAQKMESIGRLTGGIAHDFNNMLASILGFTDLSMKIAEDNHMDKLRSYLEYIDSSGERAKSLVQQMLAFGRAQQGNPETVELGGFLEEVANLLRPMLTSSIQLSVNADSDIVVYIDPVHLQQVLMNLCINARDSMAGHGVLMITAQRKPVLNCQCRSCYSPFSGDYIELAVSDTGEGVSAEIAGKMFEPFVTNKAVGEGSGLGLSMVHGILHEYDGHIDVKTAPGKGTTIRLYLKEYRGE